MLKYIQENLRYPEEALQKRIEGIVELSYVINGLGKIIEVKVLKGIGHGCDKEAIRLVKSLVYEKAYNHGLNTRTKRGIKIPFKLPKSKKVQLNYQIVKAEKKPQTPKKAPTTYQIQVNIPRKDN